MEARRVEIPRLYDDEFDDGDTRLDPRALLAGVAPTKGRQDATILMPAAATQGATVLMPAAVPPAMAHIVANAPARVDIRVVEPSSPSVGPASDIPATSVEWVVAITAGLVAAILIGVIAAVI